MFDIFGTLMVSVAELESEPEPVEPKLFETWSRHRSRSRISFKNFNKYFLESVCKMLG